MGFLPRSGVFVCLLACLFVVMGGPHWHKM